MDHEYLQNVMGSPYVNEGAFSRLKAKGAQAMSALGTMTGQPIQRPVDTQLRSLWEGFMSSLKRVMKDWEGVSQHSFDANVEMDEQGQRVKEALDALSNTLKSQLPSKIGSAPNQIHDPTTRNPRDNPQSYVKGSAYNRSTTSPKLKELAPDYLQEGFWTRDIGLNKALGSNDPAKILNSYKNSVLSLFKNFMKDAVKMTKMTAQQVYAALAKIQPAQSGYQAPGNMQKVVQQLQTLQSVGDVGAAAQQTAQQPAAGAEAPQAGQQPSDQPSAQSQQPGATPESPQQAGQQKPSDGTGIQGGEGGAITADELPSVILKSIEIIIDAVTSDISHTGKYFDKDATGQITPLPPDYGTGQSMTKESTSPPKSHGAPAGGEAAPEKEEPEEKERKGEFVYNFHSKQRKFPGTNFSIQVKPVKVNPQIEGTNISVEVWWNCEKTRNKIYSVATKNGKKSQPMLIMEFFDQEVNSKAGAMNPQSTNFFTVDKIINAANPTGPNKLEKASGDIKQKIKAAENTLFRSLMLTVGRKSMEFKPKKDKTLPIKFDEQGNVTVYEQGKEAMSLTKQQVKDKLEKSDFETSEQWKQSLDHYDYFDKFPEMKPADISDFPAFKDGVLALVAMGHGEPEAIKLASSAWMDLRTKVTDLNDITAEDIFKVAVSKQTPSAGKKKEPKAPEPPEPPTEEPPPTPPSTPPGGPPPSTPPSSPVSGAAGGPPPSASPTAPVSTAEPKPDQGKQPPAEQPPQQGEPSKPKASKQAAPQEIKIWKGEDGQMRWSNKKGQVGGLTSKTVAKFKGKPEFVAALKKAQANKFAPPTKMNPETGKEEPDKSLQEKFINPFQRANFLL